jgi:hypothetical protein
VNESVRVLPDAEVLLRRKLAVSYIEWACGYTPEQTMPEGGWQVGVRHPRYRIVTEDLDLGPTGTSCAILAHGMLDAIGVTAPWVHRAYRGTYHGASIIWDLVSRGVDWEPDIVCDGGDILVISRDWPDMGNGKSHVVCVTNHEGVSLSVGEYGQPGGKLATREIRGGSRVGRRTIRKHLSLERVLRRAFAGGQLVDPKPPEGLDWGTAPDTEASDV